MPRIEIVTPDGPSSVGTVVKMDGKEVHHARRVDVHIGVDELVSAAIEVLADEELNVVADAMVQVTVVTSPDFDVIAEDLGDGRTRYRTVAAVDLSHLGTNA